MVDDGAEPEVSRNDHLRYWLLPTAIVTLPMAMWFSGVPLLMAIAAPEFNRELGLLENLQHLAVAAVAFVGVVRFRRATLPWERRFFALMALAAVFVFLEEVDYGSHWWAALQGRGEHERLVINIHNIGGNSRRFHVVGDVVTVSWFVLLPLVAARVRHPWVAYFRPDVRFIASIAAMLVLTQTAHLLNDLGLPPGSYMRKSMAEFRELFIYLIWLTYTRDLAFRRVWPGRDTGVTTGTGPDDRQEAPTTLPRSSGRLGA